MVDVKSFTHKYTDKVVVSKSFIKPNNNILIIDDFLANGCALQGLIEITKQAKANVIGIEIAIEKGFQDGGTFMHQQGYLLESLAIIDSMDCENKTVKFR